MVARTIPNALVVPASALLTDPDGSTSIMVVGSDSRAYRKTVKTGIKEGDDLQILDGLKGDEQVISSGNYGLPDKTRVSIEAPKERAKDGTSSTKETHGDDR
jgi:multidrug efflux pump subunit AcrA (membrane-fusion protein)